MRIPTLPLALATLTAALSVSCSTSKATQRPEPTAQQTSPLPAELQQTAQRFRSDLQSSGMQVAQGSFRLFTMEDCKYAIEKMGNCSGNNPTAPYVIAGVPLWPDEYVDPHNKDVFGPYPDDQWSTFRVAPREALVILAHLPPPAAYLGLQTYVYSREGSVNPADPIYQKLPLEMRKLLFSTSPNPARVQTIATFGDAINHVMIERQSGAAWDQDRYFVITPDAAMARQVSQALEKSGAQANQIFTEPMSPEVVRVGLGSGADDLMVVIRYARPKDEQAGEQWRHQLPLTIFRVRDTRTASAEEPYPRAVYDERTGHPEQQYAPDLDSLVQAVKQKWGQPDAPVKDLVALEPYVDLYGQHCLQRPMYCLGDNQEAQLQFSPGFNIDSGEVLAMVGTLGTETGNATYVSEAVNHFEVLKGVANLSDADLKGSASKFAGQVNNADKLYLHYFARDCTGLPQCLQITDGMIPRSGTLKMLQRDYIVPGTIRGANPSVILSPKIIVFDGARRPSGDD